jgi:tetratricopeptide (TPR) repeat protein
MRRLLAGVYFLVLHMGLPGTASADDSQECFQGPAAQRIAACTRIIENESSDRRRTSITYNNRGAAHNDLGNFDKAIIDLTEAIRLGPKNYNAFSNRSYSHFRRHDYGLARSDIDACLQYNPKFAPGYTNRGRVAEALHKYDQAITDYTEALQVNPAYLNAYALRANVHTITGKKDLALADYRKVLELTAVTARDRSQQETAKSRIERHEKSRGATVLAASQRVALVIGNSAYASVGPLTNPRNDAKAMSETLRRLGFTDVSEHYDLGLTAMNDALKSFGDKAAGADWAVVFFAGHGMEMSGTNYLIPIDAKLLQDRHVPDETVSLDRIQAKVDGAAKLGLVILDACRNNPFSAKMTRSAGNTRSIGRGLGVIEPDGNVMVAFAAKHGTVAEDGSGRHSPFSESLLARVEEANLDVGILFRKVRDDVRAKTQRRQDPFIYGSLGGDMLFFKAAARR